MPAIYISYRKEDTQGAAAHLYKNLTEAFGRTAVFMDVAGNQPGRDMRDVVDDHLVSCAAVLVIIGKGWVDARDESGQRRLDNPLDPVRIETAAALEQDLPLIPVLVQGATMVYPTQLPPDLADLAFRNPVTLLQSQWGSDVEMLVALLKSLVQGHRPADSAPAAAGPAAVEAANAEPAAGATASTSSTPRVRVARPQPVGKLPWLPILGALAGMGVLAIGVYAFMLTRAPAGRAAAAAPVPARVPDAASAVAKVDALAAAVPTPFAPVAKAPPAAPAGVPASKPVPAALAPTAAAAPAAPAAKAPVVAPSPAPAPPPVVAATAPKPALPPLTSKAARVLSFQKWTLNSGGCGAGPVTATGVARFSVEKTSDAIVVTEEFRGSGGGYDVVVSGQVEFNAEQPSYEIPISGVWTSPAKTFKTTGTDRVNTSDGLTPNGASVVKFQSLCG